MRMHMKGGAQRHLTSRHVFLPSSLGPSHGAFEATCLLVAHIHVRMHIPKFHLCIFDLHAACIH